tara:strand:- start:156 stop:941 length:786 start_codon:yes stop_codon:yes gene_type:complete
MKYPKKSLGQNFLIDQNVIRKIINLISITNKNILEIGPGRGSLTDFVFKKNPKSLTLIEKDDLLSNSLKLKFNKKSKIKIFNSDILDFNLEKNLIKDTIIFGNLPYNISSQILVKLIKSDWPPKFSAAILMFQKEMADRIIAKYKSSNYGRLSILTNYRLEIVKKFNISPNCFYPKPKVTSTVIFFKPKKESIYKIKNITNLEKITNVFFSNKRKMINKTIDKIFDRKKNKINLLNLKFSSRPAELSPEMYYQITELFEKR